MAQCPEVGLSMSLHAGPPVGQGGPKETSSKGATSGKEAKTITGGFTVEQKQGYGVQGPGQ
eukprot:2002600-Prorocentrum_lima.AAC.1